MCIIIFIYQCNFNAIANNTNNNHERYHKRTGRSSLRKKYIIVLDKKMTGRQIRQKMHLLSHEDDEGHRFLIFLFSMRKVGVTMVPPFLRALTLIPLGGFFSPPPPCRLFRRASRPIRISRSNFMTFFSQVSRIF